MLKLNNDVLSIIGEYSQSTIKYSKHGLCVKRRCNNCNKNIRFTKNAIVNAIVVPEILELDKVKLDKNKIVEYNFIYDITRDADIFGIVRVDGIDYGYKQYIIDNYDSKEDINGRIKYGINWKKVPDNVKVYANVKRSHQFYYKYIKSMKLDQITSLNFDKELIYCGKCRKKRKWYDLNMILV